MVDAFIEDDPNKVTSETAHAGVITSAEEVRQPEHVPEAEEDEVDIVCLGQQIEGGDANSMNGASVALPQEGIAGFEDFCMEDGGNSMNDASVMTPQDVTLENGDANFMTLSCAKASQEDITRLEGHRIDDGETNPMNGVSVAVP